MRRLIEWADSWIETWRVAPPFSRRRRELLEIMHDHDPENWAEVDRP